MIATSTSMHTHWRRVCYLALLWLTGCSGGSNDAPSVIPPDVTVVNLSVTPAELRLPIGLGVQARAEALLSDGRVIEVTEDSAVSWTSDNPAIATVSSQGDDKGTVTGVAAGTATLTATGQANGQTFSASAQVTVTNAVVTAAQVSPPTVTLPMGFSQRLLGEAILSDGQVLDVTQNPAVSWTSDNPAIATVSTQGDNKGTVTGISAGTTTVTATGQANGQTFSASTQVTVTNAVVTAAQVSPPTVTLPIGFSQRLRGEAVLSDGQVLDVTQHAAVSWTSDNPAIAAVSNLGDNKVSVTGISAGTATVTATGQANGKTFSASTRVTVTNAVVTSGQVSPPTVTLPIGVSQRLLGEATLSDGQMLDVTQNAAVSWTSNNPAIAAVSNLGAHKGTVTGMSVGTTTITATGQANGQTFSASTDVTVTNAVVASAQVSPPTVTLPVGLSEPLRGDVTLSDGHVLEVTRDAAVSWTSGNSAIAAVSNQPDNKGVVTGMSVGSTTITATWQANGQTLSASTQVTVTNAVVASAQVSPPTVTLPVGLSAPLSGKVTLSDGQVLEVTQNAAVSWTSDESAIAAVSNQVDKKGMVTGMSVGTTTIKATGQANGKTFSASTHVTVTDAVVTSLEIEPQDTTLPIGLSAPLTAVAVLSDNRVLEVTQNEAVSWVSDDEAVAIVNNHGEDKGKVFGVSKGTALITASGYVNGRFFSATAKVTVTDAVVIAGQITPSTPSVPVGLGKQLNAQAILSNGQTLDVTRNDAVSWSSDDMATATVSNGESDKGVVTGLSTGDVTITATGSSNGKIFSATQVVTVTNAIITNLTLQPDTTEVPVGLSKALKAIATLSSGQSLDVTQSEAVDWSSGDPRIATVSDNGMVTGVSAGVANLRASVNIGGDVVDATATVTVTPAIVTGLQLTPAQLTVPIGLSSPPLVVNATLSDGTTLDVTASNAVALVSGYPVIATVSNSQTQKGKVTGVSQGKTPIIAYVQITTPPLSATAEVTVRPPIEFFTPPDLTVRNWDTANTYCQTRSPAARLPTVAELQNLFIQSTSATEVGTETNDMCTRYGWPLRDQCGSQELGVYWASDIGPAGNHGLVYLSSGDARFALDTFAAFVACVR
ncbi:Ig-like domain-containing protein [Aeromonas salmonicida]|uniref:Ig-like domain-containing protein n=1 Tax=Aeromonas salmonicida TaxID=645 RepID=UPI003D01F93B